MKNVLVFFLAILALTSFGQSKFPTGIRVGKNNSSTAGAIDSIATSGTKIKFYRGTTMLTPFNADTISGSSVFLQIKDSLGYGIGNYMTRQNVLNDAGKDNTIKFLNLDGAGIKGTSVLQSLLNGTNNMTDGSFKIIKWYFDKTETINGLKFMLSTAGVYTADQYNGVGLYSISGTTYTLIASSTNDGNIWKSTAGTLVTTPFTTPVVVNEGFYYVALLYNSSAQTTAPAIYVLDVAGTFINSLGTNMTAAQATGKNTFPTPVLSTDVTTSVSGCALLPY